MGRGTGTAPAVYGACTNPEVIPMRRRSTFAISIALTLTLAAAVAAPLVVQAGGGCHGPDGSVYAEGTATIVKMDVCSYAPTIERVPVGTTIRFLNSANIEHMVVGRSGTWASGILAPGAEYSATFKADGTYPFSCPLHPGMVGAIVVGTGAGVSGGASIGLPAHP
jgi:plastocyanin